MGDNMDAWKIAIALFLVAPLMPATVHADECNPYPVGRCGAYDRELVTFCYQTIRGEMVDATDHHVIAVGGSQGVALPDNWAMGKYYVRLTPSEGFANDPYGSDLPTNTLIEETNNARGPQLVKFKCADFIWYAECDSWMIFNIQPPGTGLFLPDAVVY